MVSRQFWPIMALVLGIVAAGCELDNNDSEKIPKAKGTVTINGIPEEYNGKYIFLSGRAGNANLYGFTDMRELGKGKKEKIKLAIISDGTTNVPLYKVNPKASSSSGYIKAYGGNDIFSGNILIVDDEDSDGFFTWDEISTVRPINTKNIMSEPLSKGSFTVDWAGDVDN